MAKTSGSFTQNFQIHWNVRLDSEEEINYIYCSIMACLKFLLFPSFILVFSFQSPAQLSSKYDGYEQQYFRSMRYGFFKPAGYEASKSYPLIVYLHGSRDTVSHDMMWYQESMQLENPCFVLTPKCEDPEQGWGNTWNDKHTACTAKTLALVDSLITCYNINTKRLYLYGISMGGFGVFSILEKNPGKFAAAYAVCGGSDVKAAGKVMQTPLWIFHGEIDDVVPVKLSRDIYNEIIRLGGNSVRYTEYPGVKHNSWENVGREQTLGKWLFLQEKGKAHGTPDAVLNFKAEAEKNGVRLRWDTPSSRNDSDKEVWYYKIFRDSEVVAEADGDVTTYMDSKPGPGNHTYSIVAVNYFFKRSLLSPPFKVTVSK